MTDTFGNRSIVDEISDDDTATARLDRQASDLLAGAENRAFASTTSIRKAVREDVDQVRQLARDKAEAARDAIVDSPVKSALYAVGIGVLIGLLLRR